MPITRKISDSAYEIVFWKIEESIDRMLAILGVSPSGNVSVQEKRTAHHLAGRAAMQSLLPDDQWDIVKDEYGKPHTRDGRYHLSVSHSGDYAVAIGSAKHEVGIDIERIGNRITKIAEKFVGPDESQILVDNDELKALYLIWSAKEAMYKLYGRKALDFRDNLFVEPFDLKDSGELTGRIEKGNLQWVITLRYELFEGYSLVWTTGSQRLVEH